MYNKEFIFTEIYNKKYILSPTNEEQFMYIFSNEINSINDFPIKLFQINNKFRNEIRIKNEILRTNEFIMKDGYSIHYNYLCSNNTYLSLYETYKMIFIKFKIKFFILKINNENNYYSHEFRSLSNIGNKIKFNENNIEYNNTKNIFLNSIEIAHIFKMGNKYSNFFKKKK
ncbi:aminoacyl--tRNA ligase-related protein [Candidatus Nardonella dryophthoridicola]|nr:aminoacyl--tRNA ligase-related protein [Candidatus Nardonella dryophthoridicola]